MSVFNDLILGSYVYFGKHPCCIEKITVLGNKITLIGRDVLTGQERKTFGSANTNIKSFIPIVENEQVVIKLKDKIVTMDKNGSERFLDIDNESSVFEKITEGRTVEVTTLISDDEKTFIHLL